MTKIRKDEITKEAYDLKNSRHFFILSEVKPKPIVTRSHTFSRVSGQLLVHMITMSFDWFTVLSVPIVISW